jgi:hypothetical protein
MLCPYCLQPNTLTTGEDISDQSFCIICGKDITEKLCQNCHKILPATATQIMFCPYCGSAVVESSIPTELYEVAKNWPANKSVIKFVLEELGLPTRVANPFARNGFTPLEVLELSYDRALGMRNFGEKAYQKLDIARRSWKPKS